MGAKSVCYSLAYHGWPRLESFADDGCAMGNKRRSIAKTAKQAPTVRNGCITTACSHGGMWQEHCDGMDPLATGMLACLAEVWCEREPH
jgi:hypothetical protein